MDIEVRIYRRYDIDLYSLCDAGFPVFTMIKEVIIAYAHSVPLHFLIDEYVPFEFNDKQKLALHSRIHIPDSDTETVHMMKSIKSGLRNSFCKTIFRNALLSQNMCGYFTDKSLVKLYNNNLNMTNIGIPGTKPVSMYKRDSYKITLIGKTVTVKSKSITLNKPENVKSSSIPYIAKDVIKDSSSQKVDVSSHESYKNGLTYTHNVAANSYSPVEDTETTYDIQNMPSSENNINKYTNIQDDGIIETTDTNADMNSFMDAFDSL